jgi:hypothetical protein
MTAHNNEHQQKNNCRESWPNRPVHAQHKPSIRVGPIKQNRDTFHSGAMGAIHEFQFPE